MKDDILEQIERLKLMILADKSIPSSESEKFHKWVAEMQGRYDNPWQVNFNNARYAEFTLIRSCVIDLFRKEFGNLPTYRKSSRDIDKELSEAVAMTLFYLEELTAIRK